MAVSRATFAVSVSLFCLLMASLTSSVLASDLLSQMFQATATISWWASSFLREDTEDKIFQMEQEVSPRDNVSNFNTKSMFLTCNLVLQDYQKLFLGFSMIWNFFLVCPRCTMYLYLLTRSRFPKSRPFCQLTLAPSVDRILNFSLSLC